MIPTDSRRAGSRPEAGFSLVELLVVLLLIGLMAIWGYPSFLQTIGRLRLTGTAREAAVFMQIARMEASKRSVPTRVVFEDATSGIIGRPSLLAYADLDSSGTFVAANDRILAGPYQLPKGVDLWGPEDVAEELVHSINSWCVAPPAHNCGPTFSSDGSANSVGAFRFRDSHGNFIETRIEFAGTGKVILQKWFGPDDQPANWFENGEAGNEWVW